MILRAPSNQFNLRQTKTSQTKLPTR